jgi:hypothetical protein
MSKTAPISYHYRRGNLQMFENFKTEEHQQTKKNSSMALGVIELTEV